MIVLNLCCENGHAFEGWFASSDAFDAQHSAGQVDCPVCGSASISRLPSAPYVRTGAPARPPATAPFPSGPSTAAALVAKVRELARQAEDVGKAFPAEVRRIHQGDAPERAIRGQATLDDVVELLDEGIAVLPVPPAKEDLH
ncbi:DUF1178 family protein [Denitromonas iodatirespirans]|uniref:DUF1178 family protein n=1 Tax=Denitromonas iodatirespirans TaxID=2795389 RepID=A0A944D9V6_DENI1|nr:DUF1178 family protein [Denitromonas iodatirespirans]MBT0961407.1 DUF1178 family protein [Denitromonas iodatirespirans]